MLMAEFVQFHPGGGGFDIVRGGVNNLIVEGLPATIPKLSMAYSLRIPWDDRERPISWSVELRDPNGVPMPKGWATNPPRAIVAEPRRPEGRDIHLLSYQTLNDLELRHEGRYNMRVLVDQQVRGETHFEVIIGTDLGHDILVPTTARE